MSELRQILAIAAVLLVSACSNGPNSKFEDFGTRANTRDFGHKYAQPLDAEELVMGPGDVVNIQIANNPTLSGNQAVRVEGAITMPFVGNVKIAGLGPSQIRDKLEILLSPYIREVTVQVIPIKINSKRIYIFAKDLDGSIQLQALAMQGDMTLIDLFAAIGGVPRLADDCNVKVTRGDPINPKTLTINVRDMIVNGYTGGNIQMRPDDIVYLPPTFWAKVAISVRQVTLPVRELSNAMRGVIDTIDLAQGNNTRRRR